MDQRVYLRLENGEIVALEDGTIPGTSYIVQDGVLASTSNAVQDNCTPGTSYVVDSTSLQNQTYTERNESAQEEYVAEPTTLENIAVENDGTENVVYIVQHEGGTTDGMQYAVIGESGSVGSSFAVQTVSSGSTDAGSEKTVDYTNITSIQDMSGIETLSRVATQEFAGSVIPSNSGTGTSQSIKGDYSGEAKSQNENELAEGNNDENISLSFYCQHCAETFEELESFRLHLKSEHDIIDVGGVSDSENVLTLFPTCQLCAQTFVDAKELEEHKKVHAGEFDPSSANTKSDQSSKPDKQAKKGNFKCRFCDNYFDNKSMMREHVATEHPDKSLPEEIKSSSFTKCPYCHKMYVLRGNNKSLIKHINLSHPGKSVDVVSSLADKEDQLEEKINCPFCDVGFFWEKSLIRHMKDQHPKILEETGDDIFAELGVQDVQTPNRRYRRSLNDGNQDVTLACPECPRKFLWEKSLRRHMVELHNEPTLRSRRNKKGPRVFQCPHCSLVSKYACAVRKHMERKHPEKVKGVDVSKLQLPTIEADAATDIELKTVDKRPAEERLNYCRFIFRCPFCTYACKQSSNLIRHLTSIKHGNIFSPEEIKDIGINSFKVEQKMVTDGDEEENLDGTLNKRLSKLRLKGKLLDIVMTKYEILKQRKLENKENGIDGGENEDDFSDMDIDNIINVAEDESEESFNEEEDDDDDEKGRLEQTNSKRGTRKSKDAKTAEQKTEEKNEKDNGNIMGHADSIDIKTLNSTKHMTDGTEQVTAKGNENIDEKRKEEKSGQKSDITTTDIEMIEILPLENTSIENDSDNEMDIDTDTGMNTVQLNNFGSSCRIEPNTSSRKLNTEDKVTSKQEINRLNGKNSRENNQRENQGNKQRIVDIQNKSASAADKVTSVGEKKMPLRSKSKPVEAANGNSGKMNTKANSLVCEVCHREFSSFTVFKEHLPSHVNIKVIFRCKECEYEFPFLKDLKSHMKKEHNRSCSENDVADVHTNLVKMNSKPVTTYDCPYCEMLFSQSATLQQHVIIDHSGNIESTCIKRESGVTSRPTASETVVLAFNCHFCECFFHSINDIVKHMYIVHRDVERSSINTSIDSAVRKSGRKRRVPKWLEEASADSSPAKKTKGQNPGNDNQMSKASNLTPVSRPREKKQSKFAGADISKRSKETTGAEIVKEAKEGTSSVKKTKEQFQTKDTPKTKDVVELEDLNISGSDNSQGLEVERSPRSVNKGKKPFKKPEPSDIGKGPSDTQDKTENQNKCPHCDFVARRSSALTFHINLKHANVKTDIKEQEARKILAKSPKKTSTSDYPVVSRKNMETPNKGKQDIDKSGDTFVTRKGAELEKKGKTAVEMEKCQVDPDSLAKMKNNDNANSNRIQSSIGEVAELENEIEEIEDQMNDEEDYDIEFGDSDDDYKPDKDDYDDGDSDLDDLEDDDVDDGYSISVMLECPYCENGLFQSFSILESHVKKKHPEKANTFSVIDVKTKVELDGTVKSSNLVHTCKYCKKNFSSRSHVRAHVKNKHGKKLVDTSGKSSGEAIDENTEFYKCHFCSVVSESRENVLSHINRQHPLEKVHLSDIERYKPSKEDIIKNVFNCPHCEKKNIWKQGMLRHISKTHPEVKDESHKIVCEKEVVKNKPKNLYQCFYCNWQYEKRADVLAHITDTHSDQPQVTEDDIVEVDIADKVDNNFQCPYCDLKSKYKRCVIRHVNRAHSEMKGFTHSDVICLRSLKRKIAAAEGLIYMCPYCDFDSRWKQCVIRHVDINHPDVMHLKTGAIPSEYRKRSVVNLDENSELEKDNDRKLDYFKCPYCDAISETKKGVVEHTLTYHPKKSTINRSQVKKAVWDEVDISNKDFVYKCLACNSGSKRKKTVVLHVRKAHPEVKKFRIELCRAEFFNSERNTDDMYKCKLCNELFMTTRGVSAHCMHVHPDEAKIVIETVPVSEKLTNIFKCMYCDHSSGWRKAIIKHVEIHHSDIKNFQAKDVICEIVQEKELQGSGGFQCPYCNTVNHWKKSIIRHIKTVHPNERQDLEIHFNPAASVKSGGRSCRKSSKQIKCLRCGVSCRSIEKMRKHFLSKHPKLAKNYLGKGNTELVYDASNGRQLDYVCVLCSAKYMWKKSLLVHIKCRHREMFHVYQALDHVVDIVAGGTDGQWHAEQPDVSATNQPTPVSKPQVVKKDTEIPKTRRCEKCNMVFKSQWDANVHARLKHRKSLKNRFPCSKCSLSFRTQSLRLKHKIRCYRYQRCGSTLHCTVAGCNFRCKFHKVLQNHYSYSHNLKIPILGNTTFSTYGAEGSVRCEICLRTFSSADQLKQHVDLHKKSRPVRFECGTCGEQFLTRSLRDTHIETFHFDKLEMCDVCGNLYTRANLKKHIKTHEEDQSGNKVCPYCDQCFTVKMFNRHVFNEHQEILNCQCDICSDISRPGDTACSQNAYKCTVCNKSFCQKPMVYVHSKLTHCDISKFKVFSCEACPQYFFTKRMKDAHCHEHHKKKLSIPSPAASASRSTSTYNSNDPTTHVIHIGQDEGKQYLPKLSESSMNAVIKELLVFEKGAENPYKCLLCSRSFTKSKYIKLHIRRAHVRDEDQPYRCKVCGSGFVRLTEFRKHSRSHSDFRPYKCRYCDKAFKQQANLRDHYRVHTNSKDYKCYYCKTEFRQRGGLTSHVVFHDTLKPYKCMYCQKGFTTRGELSRHMQKYNKGHQTETSEKSYPCHICEESFPHYPMLLKHIDSHNPDKPFQCVACKEKFSNFVSMYFHKVKEEHFLLEEIQEGVKDLEKRGRKFRAKRNSMKPAGPEIVYASNQPIAETVYISQPDVEGETSIKPVEVIIEQFGQDQVVRVQENEPEHEELLSIAKQLTELSGFAESEYYTTKKNVHQEEDEIIKDMLDADDDVLANLSKQSVGNKVSVNERDRRKAFERTEQVDEQKESEEEDYDYMPEIENDSSTVVSVAGHEESRYMMEAGGQINISNKSIPTNMEELVSLVSQNSSVGNNEHVMAYQSEDGTVIYVCLPDDQGIKTEEVVAEETTGESGVVGDNSETVIQETESSEFNMECNENAEELYEEANETVPDENQIMVDTVTAEREEHPLETNAVNVQIPAIEQPDAEEIPQTKVINDDHATHTDEKDFCVNEQMETDEVEPLKSKEIQMANIVTNEQVINVTNEQQIIVANPIDNSAVEEVQSQDYSIVEPNYENSVITIKPQDSLVKETPESHEDLIRRSQLARHLTGNIEPLDETTRTPAHLFATEQGLQSIVNEEPLDSQNMAQGENTSQGLITIATTAATVADNETNMVESQVTINDSSGFEQVSVARPGDSFVEGEETLVEYQIDESRFIKEELLDADYAEMRDKERDVMFFSDNIYTYSQIEKKFICLHCGAKIGTFKNLKNHIRRHAPLSARTHICTFCPKRFVTKNELKRHLCTHTGERNYECKECGKKFLQPGHLQEHMRLHTGDKPFPCSECTAAFITKSQLVLHWSRLHSNNEIPCSKCDKVFKTQIDLRRHKGLEHSGTKVHTPVEKEEGGDHVCDICGKAFNVKAALKRHLEKHNLENLDESEKVVERFACGVCGVSFKSKYYVKEHIKIAHTEEKSEICELCGMGFKTKSLLRRHRESKHPAEDGNNKWFCNICNKSLGSKYAYGYHMGAKH